MRRKALIQEPDSTGWSIVMTGGGFPLKEMEAVDTATREVLGREGLDHMTLTLMPEKHLPAELAADVLRQQAEDLSARLSELGGVVHAVPTAEVSGVKHRATEMWANRCQGTYRFTELDGLIIHLPAINARDCLAVMRETRPHSASWEVERALKHDHVFGLNKSYDECLEEAERIGAGIEQALRGVYPKRAFTVSHNFDIVSFWQTTPDSPRGEYLCLGRRV